MAGERFLIIDDDRNSVRFLQLELEHEGYRVEKEYDGLQGLQRAKQEQFDIILLDIMLPGMDGMKVLHKIRQISDTPVIMLTAKDAVSDKVQGLDGGADDYLTKPFAIEELLARMRVR
jgi:two-component system, OmpR family, response regulator ArlR